MPIMLSQLLYAMRKNFRWMLKFRLSHELKQRARQDQLNKKGIRKTIIPYILVLRKVIELIMYNKYIFSLACCSVSDVGIFRGGSYRSSSFVLSE